MIKAKGAKTFDINRSVMPLLCTILQRRAKDLLRRKVTSESRHDQVVAKAQARIAGSKTGDAWRALSPLLHAEFRELVMDAITQLPDQQRVVCGVYYRVLDADATDHELAEEVSHLTGQPATVAGVKKARREGTKKIREALGRLGFSLEDLGEL